jgi:7-cyano-7-deazaguanine synthase
MASVVLLSGGLDSATNLYIAHQVDRVALTLTMDYGQKAAQKETESAIKLSSNLGLKNIVVQLPWFTHISSSALTNESRRIPTGEDVKIDDLEVSRTSARSVWVPNRNGIFLNIAAGFAESLGADSVVPGFNLEEAVTFPDNSESFVKAMDTSLYFSTSNEVKIKCYTVQMNKTEILAKALSLKLPIGDLWPCYDRKEKWCGQCESCLRSKRAFHELHLDSKSYFINEYVG